MGFFDLLRGKPQNSLEETAAEKIFKTSVESVMAVYKQPGLLDQNKVSEQGLIVAMFEFSFFCVHLLNREIFKKYGAAKRDVVLDKVLDSLKERFMSKILKDYNDNDKNIINAVFGATYQEAEQAYGNCRSFSDEKTSIASRRMGGAKCTAITTVFKERLYKAYTEEDLEDIVFISAMEFLTISTLKSLDIPGMISRKYHQ